MQYLSRKDKIKILEEFGFCVHNRIIESGVNNKAINNFSRAIHKLCRTINFDCNDCYLKFFKFMSEKDAKNEDE